MPKSNARKTADAIHNIPEYYGPQTDEPTDGMKKGDIWFESDGLVRQSTLKKKSGKLPTRTKTLKKLRRK
jgi:hypothetical protein